MDFTAVDFSLDQLAAEHDFEIQKGTSCCSSCALAEFPEGTVNFCYYHQQNSHGDGDGMHLGWGGDAATIVSALRANGLTVEWDGTDAKKIFVEGDGTGLYDEPEEDGLADDWDDEDDEWADGGVVLA